MTALILSACWIGDRDDYEVQYDSTLIEVLCQTPGAQTFCQLSFMTPTYQSGASEGAPIVGFVLGQSGIGGSDQGIRCASSVETVFAPSDSAWQVYVDRFPHWNSVNDIPQDTLFTILKHHIVRNKKLHVQIDNPVCADEEIQNGAIYQMWDGRNWQFQVVNNQLAALSLANSQFTVDIYSPDTTTTDGIVYVIDKVLGPF